MSQRGRLLHQLNLKASSYQTLEEDFKRQFAWLPTLLPKTSLEEQGLEFSRAKLICRLGKGNKDIFESQLARQVSQLKRSFSTGKKTHLMFFKHTINSQVQMSL